MKRFRSGWISDVHLGTRGSQAATLLDFLREYEFETLYVVGDLIDVWSLRRGIYWPQLHNDVIQKLLRAGRKGTQIIYIPGNHDEFIGSFHGEFGNISVQAKAKHRTADGRTILVIHGHELDTVVQNIKWLALLGDVGYQTLLKLNSPINVLRRMFGLPYWSLSAYVKGRVKNAVSFISRFEEEIVRYSREEKVDAVLCGHIHSPALREDQPIPYYNCGDWVESCSALVEDFEGKLHLVFHVSTGSPANALPEESSANADAPERETEPAPAGALLVALAAGRPRPRPSHLGLEEASALVL